MTESNPQRGASEEFIKTYLDQLRSRLDASDRQRERAVEVQAETAALALEREREYQGQQLKNLQDLLETQISRGDGELLTRIEGIQEAGNKLAQERDRAAEALRLATQKALDNATEERIKAAAQVATQLEQMITAGDENLRLHIKAQEQQLQAMNRETALVHDASEKAISKAEAANEKRFEQHNGLQQQMRDLITDLMPRELAEAQFKELKKDIDLLRGAQDIGTGKSTGTATTIGYVIAVATLVITMVVIVVNVLLSVL